VAAGHDIAVIEYHSTDDYSNVFGDYRLFYYNATYFPFPLIDGIIQPIWSSYNSYETAYEERKSLPTNYSINMDMLKDSLDFSVSVHLIKIGANIQNKVLHLVLTESHIPEVWYGGDELHYVQRLMIPDQYGTSLENDKSENTVYDLNFSVDPSWDTENCELVAFVQDVVTKEIFQANTFLLADAVVAYYDAGIVSIDFPGQEFCGSVITPKITIVNQSFQTLTDCLIKYTINGTEYSYAWNGSLDVDEILGIELPEVSINLAGENTISVELGEPNGHEDSNPDNNILEKTFFDARTIAADILVLEVQTDDKGYESRFEIRNSDGALIFIGDNFENNNYSSFEISFSTDDCYRLIALDEGGDGMCCSSGEGFYRLKDYFGSAIFYGAEFGESEISMFQVDVATNLGSEFNDSGPYINFNSNTNSLSIGAEEMIKTLEVYNFQGQIILQKTINNQQMLLNLLQFKPGIYFLRIETNGTYYTEKIIVS